MDSFIPIHYDNESVLWKMNWKVESDRRMSPVCDCVSTFNNARNGSKFFIVIRGDSERKGRGSGEMSAKGSLQWAIQVLFEEALISDSIWHAFNWRNRQHKAHYVQMIVRARAHTDANTRRHFHATVVAVVWPWVLHSI